MQVLQPPPDRNCVPFALLRVEGRDVGNAQRDQYSVDRPPRAVLLEESQEFVPAGTVGTLMGILFWAALAPLAAAFLVPALVVETRGRVLPA